MKAVIRKVAAYIIVVAFVIQAMVNVSYCEATAKPVKIVLNKKKLNLYVGQKFKIKVKSIKPKKASKAVKYKSANKKVAKVTKKGLVKAIKKGSTKITVTSKKNKKVKATVKVKVRNKKVPVQTEAPVMPVLTATPVVSETPKPVEPIYNPDYSALVARSDINYQGIIDKSTQGIPVANGRFGGPVWEKDARTLSMQLNHTDTFMYNDASANSTDESGGLARLEVDFGKDIFGDDTTQNLSLYEGNLAIKNDEVDVNVIADMNSDAMLIRIDDKRDNPSDITISLGMLREPNVKRGAFSANSYLSIEENQQIMMLRQVFEEQCNSGIAENDYYCSTAVGVSVAGRDFDVDIADSKTAKIHIAAQSEPFTIIIGGDSTMDDSVDIVGNAVENVLDANTFESVFTANKVWWSDFWHKSYVYLPDCTEYEIRRNYYMYLAAISNRGSYPSKYNGGIWISEGDRRDWGNWYWNWNQDSLYQPLFQANYGELMEPLFKMRESCYDNYKIAAKQLWGMEDTEALFIGETSGILGAEILPDDIAADLQKYLAGEGELTTALENFGNARNSFLVPWNWKLSGDSVSYVTHTMVATQETAEYYWQRYCYTKDETWLKDYAYKFIKGAAELYRNYSGFVMEDDGYYHFYRTNLHEHIWGGKDVIDDLSLARGIFAVAVKASEILNVDAELRSEWKHCLDNLAPYPLSSDPDAIGFTVNNKSGNETWAQGLKPASLVRALEGSESPQFKMLEKFDVLNMETRDQGLDDGDWEIAINTFYDTPGYLNQYINDVVDENGSSRFLEDVAKLGLSEELEVIMETQFKMFRDTPNLLHDQGDYYSAEGYGTWSAAIQQALNQSLAPKPGEEEVIRVFPAWPKSMDARYKLLAKGGFLVSSSMVGGDIQYVEIESQIGGTCRIRNPWNSNIVLYRNGQQTEKITAKENELITFDTVKGEDIVLVRENTTPDMYRSSHVNQ